MFDVTEWLEKHAYGYENLSGKERQAITDFSLLWSLFEAQALGTSASASKIVEECKNLCEPIGRVRECHFSDSLAYFQRRYTEDGVVNHHFDGLHLPKGYFQKLVKDVLLSHEPATADKLAACLIIVYRYRNNYFHGIKWATEFRDQQENFEESNKLLAFVLDRLNDG